MQKQAQWKIRGMQRDSSASAFSSEFAYDNKNIRIMATNESTLLSLTNERGNKKIGDSLIGIPIGQNVIDNELIIFTAGDYKNISINGSIITDINIEGEEVANIDIDSEAEDRIYKVWFNKNNDLESTRLYRGQLNFDYKHPIESIVYYENSELKKLYWVDGLNQPRVINTEVDENTRKLWGDTSFDFVSTLKLQETVLIERNDYSNGTFSPGVIQYAFTYYTKYGQESNIFYTSPLYYTSYVDRGANPEDKTSNSFNISISNIDTSMDYVRVYSIHRTSINGEATVKRVVDLGITSRELVEKQVTEWQKLSTIDSLMASRTNDPLSPFNNNFTSNPTEINDEYTEYTFNDIVGEDYVYEVDRIEYTDGSYMIPPENEAIVVRVYNDITKIIIYLKPEIEKIPFTIYSQDNILTYTDIGTSGDIADSTELLYVGGEETVFNTISQKDNTLFLGDITIKRKTIPQSIKEAFKNKDIVFISTLRSLKAPTPSGNYPYINQLRYSSKDIKTFKYLETYRFGVQFQHKTGKWSEPIWINDTRNEVHIQNNYTKEDSILLPEATFTFNNADIIMQLVSLGYVKARPVVVLPSLSDRECICQGVLCPTVFNVGDRAGNSPFAQSSWFTRANLPYNIDPIGDTDYNTWVDREDSKSPSLNSKKGVVINNKSSFGLEGPYLNSINRGAWAEFRHLRPIPDNKNRNAEIQNIVSPPRAYLDKSTETTPESFVANYSNNFYVDQSIITLHSPDIEFDSNIKNMDTSNLQLRIVGMVPLTGFVGDINIQTSTPARNYLDFNGNKTEFLAPGFYKEPISATNISRFGGRGLMSGCFWLDASDQAGKKDGDIYSGFTSLESTVGFVIYPFHRNGPLNNTSYDNTNSDGTTYKSAMLDKKKLSNLRYSYNTYFLDTTKIWNPYEANSSTKLGISGASIFDSNEVSVTKIPAPLNSGLSDIVYYGNVDKLLTIPCKKQETAVSSVYSYPIVITGLITDSDKIHNLFINDYRNIKEAEALPTSLVATDPIRMKYKSTPHAVMALNYFCGEGTLYQRVLPTIKDTKEDGDSSSTGAFITVNPVDEPTFAYFWDKDRQVTLSQDVLDIPLGSLNGTNKYGYSIEYSWLWLGELYNPNVTNRFGGQTEEAFENNQWLPCGEAVPLINDTTGITSNIELTWKEGDTYYQRYDHLKTYPFTTEDQNAITDIVSFMCETRVNIDGRYDRNRGQNTNFTMTPANFNLINDVYSQQNNYFNYRSINSEKLNLDNFHNSITWTKTKTIGELVDTWTNITLASTLDLDGDKGPVRALKRLGNDIISFQDRGISQILYNDNMQISSSAGVPIEIANSGKVNGKRYLSDKVGCTNKWSICESPNGIYFIDNITKGIFLFNGKLDNISDRLGLHSWINSESTTVDIWNPVDFNNFVTYYDKTNGDVFFISKEECLAFSEPLGQFSSFYSYEKMPYFTNLEDKGIAINKGNSSDKYGLWLHNEGDYNMYFDKYQPFYTTIVANPDMPIDKIFDNLEFRSDSWDKEGNLLNTTFDTLTTWNEYQQGTSTLNNNLGRPSNLKKKFRIWRANIPRASLTNSTKRGRDRMRNPWLYIKLSMEGENINKTILHDMIVHYFE